MGRVVSIKVPVWAIPAGAAVHPKDALSAAALLRLDPMFEGLDGAGRIERVRLDQKSDDYLTALERLHDGVPKGRICAGLIAAYYRRPDRARTDGATPRAVGVEGLAEALGFEARVAQRRLYADIRETMAQGKIGMHEASTGTGKTLAIVAAALDCVAAGERVVIATPTLGLVESVNGTLRDLAAKGIAPPAWRVIYGRREFVSRAAAVARLSEASSAELEKLLTKAEETGDWRLATWQREAPDVTGLSTCVVGDLTPKDDPGVLAYRKQFEDQGEADLVICTHAMLAIDIVLRRMRIGAQEEFKDARDARRAEGGYDYRIENMLRTAFERDEHRHLPSYAVAIVDEAHQLEQAFASVMAVDVSLWQLIRAMKTLRGRNAHAVPKEALEKIGAVFARLMPKSGEDADSRLVGSDGEEAKQFAKVLSALSVVKEASKNCDQEPEAREFVKRAREALQAFLKDPAAVAMLSYSPSKRFPRLLMGRKTTHREMHYLWSAMRAGALVSATLNVVTAAGEASTSMVRYLLNVPIDRVRSLPPIVNAETVRPVTCWTPRADLARSGWLVRPSGDDEEANEVWYDQMGSVLKRMAVQAVGGSLVLTTSYRTVEELADRLDCELGERMMVSAPDRRLAHLAEDFLDASAVGKRPVWIAVGGAWTGLDLSGVRRGFSAAADNVLTDLAITNVPFRTNRSLSHASRVMRGGNFEFFDTYVKFRQGVGRLVRNPSPELPGNRRLWILDGRLHHLKTRGRLAAFSAMLRPYRQQNFG